MKYIKFSLILIFFISCNFAVKENLFTDGNIKKYAFVYGINDYSDSRLNLRSCVNDATGIAEILEFSGYEVFLRTADTNANPDGTTSEEPNKLQFLKDMNKAKEDLSEDDIVVVFYAGHGVRDHEYNNLDLDNAEKDIFSIKPNPEYLAMRPQNSLERFSILYDYEIFAELEQIKAKSVLLLDACHSGGFKTPSPSYAPDESEEYLKSQEIKTKDITIEKSYSEVNNLTWMYYKQYKDLNEELKSFYKRNIVLAAALETKEAFEPGSFYNNTQYQHGYFTLSLLLGFRNADYNNDGYISAAELIKYSRDNMRDIVYNLKGTSSQEPNSNISSYDFIIAKSYDDKLNPLPFPQR